MGNAYIQYSGTLIGGFKKVTNDKISLVLISLIAVISPAHGQSWRDCTRGSIGASGGKSISNLRGLNPDTMKPYP